MWRRRDIDETPDEADLGQILQTYPQIDREQLLDALRFEGVAVAA